MSRCLLSRVVLSSRHRVHLVGRAGTIISVVLLTTMASGEEVPYNERIRPIFAENCLECHGPDEENRKGDLRLDLASSVKGQVIVPGHPEDSELFRRISSDDPNKRMPPAETGKSLSAAETEAIRQWILDGAKYQGHWAYEPVRAATPPPESVSGDIDRFIVSALKKQGLALAPAVTRQQLIRRVTFDLTGLPATWEEVTSFVNDDSPRAFEKVVDRLLDSTRYGERWGRHWLDLARYADTHGGSAIGFIKFPFSYTYRDYVIQAFNADVPYDRFILEQLAADQLELAENHPALAGLGFLTVGMQFRNKHDTIDDQIDVVTRGLLGLTVACARCHDHKYDAIPTADYYSLYATFASSRKPPLLPLIGKPEETREYREYLAELLRRQKHHRHMQREQAAITRSRFRMQVGLYLREIARGAPEFDTSIAFISFRTEDLRPRLLNRWRDYLGSMSEDDAVFGPWLRASELEEEGFRESCLALVEALIKENGDPGKWSDAEMLKMGSNAPRWNPLVLDAISRNKPESLLELADVYGELFARAHQRWLGVLSEAALAANAEENVPDEDSSFLDLNSPVQRQLRTHLYETGTPTAMTDDLTARVLNRPFRDLVRDRKREIENLHLQSAGSPARAMTLQEDEKTDDFHVFRRGNPIDRGEVVKPRFLQVLSGASAKTFTDGKRRLDLAKAIVDPANPLTRRVIVNWVWQHHFGQGLVRTPDDFGVRGRPPTHPELLDYLATTLIEDDWSLKKLHRRILLSDVYRQGSIENAEARTLDPENELLWRMPRRRLELEAMRDAMLAVSGELDEKRGGRPFDLLSDPVVPRRSIYAFVNRDIVSSLASTFDAPNPSSCTARRPETNVPQQTLFALNSGFIQDRAVELAGMKEITSAKSDAEKVRSLYQRAFSRSPEPQELGLALSYVQSGDGESKTNVWQRLAHVLLAANEFIFVD